MMSPREPFKPGQEHAGGEKSLREFFLENLDVIQDKLHPKLEQQSEYHKEQPMVWTILVFQSLDSALLDKQIEQGASLADVHFVDCRHVEIDQPILPDSIPVYAGSEENAELEEDIEHRLASAIDLAKIRPSRTQIIQMEPVLQPDVSRYEDTVSEYQWVTEQGMAEEPTLEVTASVDLSPHDHWTAQADLGVAAARIPNEYLRMPEVAPQFQSGAEINRARWTAEWQQREAMKKIRVIEALYGVLPDLEQDDEFQQLLQTKQPDYEQVSALYRRVVNDKVELKDVQQALKISNIIEELEDIVRYENPLEAQLKTLVILPDLEAIGLKRIRAQFPLVEEILSRFEAETHELTLFGEGQPQLAALDYKNKNHQQRALQLIEQKFKIPMQDFAELDDIYCDFIEDLATIDDDPAQSLDSVKDDFDLPQFDEVALGDPVTILQLAAGVGEFARMARATDLGLYRRYRREARRKLCIMMAMVELVNHYNTNKRKGRAELQILWRSLLSLPRRAETRPGEQGWVRDLHLASGKTLTVINRSRPRKELKSMLGKALRDGDLHDKSKFTDLNGRAFIILHGDEALLERRNRRSVDLGLSEIRRDGKLYPITDKTKFVNDHEAVFQLMDTLRAEVESLPGGPYRGVIAKYTPTGYFVGRSPGSDGQVRMAKFVLAVCDPLDNEPLFMQEIQIFIDGDGKTAIEHYDHKKGDDKNFKNKSATTPAKGSRRSFKEQILDEL